jgi:5-methyltetrahydrofolate--homocysteine methyltransferase
MSGLLYREDMDDVRRRLTTWWNGGDIGRPAMCLHAPRPEPLPTVPAMPVPPGWLCNYSTISYDYRVNQAARACAGTYFLGEAVPTTTPDLAPNCLALFLGCKGHETKDSVWCEPFINDADPAVPDLHFEPANFYWDFSLRLGWEMLRLGRGKYFVQFPDLIEGLDTLSAIRGNQALLVDLIERPEWVHKCLRRITDLYFYCYDILYDMYRDEVGGSCFWAWAPGRTAKFQCDFSAMISPAMFGEFMAPVLTEMCQRVSYSIYPWDGPSAIPHLGHLLSIARLNCIQWTPGAGAEDVLGRKWWPLFHRIIEAGKRILVYASTGGEGLPALKKEFGPRLKSFMINCWVKDRAEAQKLIDSVTF